MGVVCYNYRHNRNLGLDRKMESSLLEGQHVRLFGVGARALGEDEYGLALGTHGLGSAVEGCAGAGAVDAVDEDGFGELHCGGGLGCGI